MCPARSICYRWSALRLLRYVLLAVLFVVTTGGLGPTLARALGASAHVCQCASAHQDCLCTLCHPDRPGEPLHESHFEGRCGDEAQAELVTPRLALPPRRAPVVAAIMSSAASSASSAPVASAESRDLDAPPKPPPRTA